MQVAWKEDFEVVFCIDQMRNSFFKCQLPGVRDLKHALDEVVKMIHMRP
jgi:hypothetical protein